MLYLLHYFGPPGYLYWSLAHVATLPSALRFLLLFVRHALTISSPGLLSPGNKTHTGPLQDANTFRRPRHILPALLSIQRIWRAGIHPFAASGCATSCSQPRVSLLTCCSFPLSLSFASFLVVSPLPNSRDDWSVCDPSPLLPPFTGASNYSFSGGRGPSPCVADFATLSLLWLPCFHPFRETLSCSCPRAAFSAVPASSGFVRLSPPEYEPEEDDLFLIFVPLPQPPIVSADIWFRVSVLAYYDVLFSHSPSLPVR